MTLAEILPKEHALHGMADEWEVDLEAMSARLDAAIAENERWFEENE